jgi:hypothetical protein
MQFNMAMSKKISHGVPVAAGIVSVFMGHPDLKDMIPPLRQPSPLLDWGGIICSGNTCTEILYIFYYTRNSALSQPGRFSGRVKPSENLATQNDFSCK